MKNISLASEKRRKVNKALRIIGIVVLVVVIIAAIVASMSTGSSGPEKAWDTQMTMGNPEAKNHFIVYSDLICPYCVAFENAIVEHEDEFKQYLEDNDIFFEVRLSDFLYEYGESNPIHSRYSAIAAYCARNEGKFWDYYNKAITSVWRDFFKSSGKAAISRMSKLTPEYWVKLGESVGLGDSFKSCYEDETPLVEIENTAEKTSHLVAGMPYFKFNNYTSSGFDLSWGWEYVKMYFQAGLDS